MFGSWFAELMNGVMQPAVAVVEEVGAALLLIWCIKKAYSSLTGN